MSFVWGSRHARRDRVPVLRDPAGAGGVSGLLLQAVPRNALLCPLRSGGGPRRGEAPTVATLSGVPAATSSAARVGSVTLDECTRCGGLWVDSRSFRRICEQTEEQTVILTATEPAGGPPEEVNRPARYWPCPECRRLMHRQNFARVSGVIVDTCRGHGVWFNQGELRRIVEFIREGGMDRARDHEKAELREERARLRQAENDVRLGITRDPSSWRSGGEARTSDVEILSAVRGLIDWLP